MGKRSVVQDLPEIKSIQDTTLLRSAGEVVSDVLKRVDFDNIFDIVKESQTLNEFSRRIGCEYDCRVARMIIKQLQLNADHFKRFKLEMPDEYIAEICQRSNSYYEMGQWLGYTKMAAFAAAKRCTEQFGFSTDHFYKRKYEANLFEDCQWDSIKVNIILEQLCIGAIVTGDWIKDDEIQKSPLFLYPEDVIDDPNYIAIQNEYHHTHANNKTENKASVYGFIYLITNRINGLQYIGQTTQSIEKRWQEHVSNGKSNSCNSRIDSAIQMFGIKNFEIETIDYCYSVDELNDKEKYWIAKYDCCAQDGEDRGYNWERGGDQYPDYILDEKYILDLYESGKSFSEIAKIIGTKTSSPIRRIIEKEGVTRNSEENLALFRASYNCRVARLDENGNILQLFPSYADAGVWILEQGLSNACDVNNAANTIRKACLGEYSSCGFYWISGSSYKELENRPKKSLEKLTPPKKPRQSSPSKPKICETVGCNRIIDKKAHHCLEHAQLLSQKVKIDLDKAIVEIIEDGFEATGRKYGISGNAIKKRIYRAKGFQTKQELYDYAIDKQLYESPFSLDDINTIKDFILNGMSKEAIQDKYAGFKNELYIRLCQELNLSNDNVEELKSKRQQSFIDTRFKKVEQWSADGETLIATFPNIKEAAESLTDLEADFNYKKRNIRRCCSDNRRETAFGFKWIGFK